MIIRTLKKRTWRARLFTFPWTPWQSHRVCMEEVADPPFDAKRKRVPAVWRKRPFDGYRHPATQPVRNSEPAPLLGSFNPFPLPYATSPQRTLALVDDNNSIVSGGGGAFDGGGASGRWESPAVIEHAATQPMSYSSNDSCSPSSSSSDSSSYSSSDSSSSSSSDSGSCSSSSDS